MMIDCGHNASTQWYPDRHLRFYGTPRLVHLVADPVDLFHNSLEIDPVVLEVRKPDSAVSWIAVIVTVQAEVPPKVNSFIKALRCIKSLGSVIHPAICMDDQLLMRDLCFN